MKNILLAVLLFTFSIGFSQSKVGTINTDVILSQMPELEGVETEMKKYGTELDQKMRDKYAEYQKLVAEFTDNEDEMNDVIKKFKQNELADLEEDIQTMQESSQQKMRAKQEELLRPLYTKIGNAIEVIVEDENFTQIFNEGSNLIYISPEYDVTEKAMKILGLDTSILEPEEE
ncbi:OmpH family outer membrane protein [Psychroflexus planctonicus]|uniref:Periplasmic chaperone for outer membrane proteins Skp n=1 Tax=Psychroflexus planctonicus TaxID=1526575 RepID=A0ABQ1SK16_9FLAO|nr:OmpH family outer membrane protein [Psychroflexus planctonicus]GGE42519.1 hypothetical protein GCM10010832_23090 [Psychroflexus planctonicus]